MNSRQALGSAAVLAAAAAAIALLAFDNPPGASAPVIICIDSTISTENVRETYLKDIETVVKSAAEHESHLYVADCGPNATGGVHWPVDEEFSPSIHYDGLAAEQYGKHEATKLEPQLQELIEKTAKRGGTPLGEMLAVSGRQCRKAGGGCTIYLFTDGEWVGGGLKVSDGVDKTERRDYLHAYARLKGLTGAEVEFIGVGFGTKIGELHLDEAEGIADELVERAGGHVGAWSTRL